MAKSSTTKSKSHTDQKFIPKLLLTSKAAEYLGFSAVKLNNLRNEGAIEQHSPGFYARHELDRYVKHGPRKPKVDEGNKPE